MSQLQKSSTSKKKKLYKKCIEIFTDGSYSPNGDKCGYGVYFYDVDINNISRPFTHTPLTNQRAELYAIYRGIGTVIKIYSFDTLIIYTDSAYSIGCFTKWIGNWKANNWKTSAKKDVKNVDIIKKVDAYLSIPKYKDKIKFEHVKAHTTGTDYKSVGNRHADKLAVDGANNL
jgi:ribonuclease HI